MQLYAACIANNFGEATKNCCPHIEPLFVSNALVEVYKAGNCEEGEEDRVGWKRRDVFEDRVLNGAEIKRTIGVFAKSDQTTGGSVMRHSWEIDL